MRATLYLLAIPFLLTVFASAGSAAIRADAAFPGGNIIVDSINLNPSVNTNPLFGRITTAANPRQVQRALKLNILTSQKNAIEDSCDTHQS